MLRVGVPSFPHSPSTPQDTLHDRPAFICLQVAQMHPMGSNLNAICEGEDEGEGEGKDEGEEEMEEQAPEMEQEQDTTLQKVRGRRRSGAMPALLRSRCSCLWSHAACAAASSEGAYAASCCRLLPSRPWTPARQRAWRRQASRLQHCRQCRQCRQRQQCRCRCRHRSSRCDADSAGIALYLGSTWAQVTSSHLLL